MSAHPNISDDVTVEVWPFAERLRFKGQLMRYTDYGGQTWDYRVTSVSMPDVRGGARSRSSPPDLPPQPPARVMDALIC